MIQIVQFSIYDSGRSRLNNSRDVSECVNPVTSIVHLRQWESDDKEGKGKRRGYKK